MSLPTSSFALYNKRMIQQTGDAPYGMDATRIIISKQNSWQDKKFYRAEIAAKDSYPRFKSQALKKKY